MQFSGKFKTVIFGILMGCVLLCLLFVYMVDLQTTPWKWTGFAVNLSNDYIIFQRPGANKIVPATTHLPAQSILDDASKSSVINVELGTSTVDAQDTAESLKGNHSNRFQASSSTQNCSPADMEGIHRALNGSRLPEDLTYMSFDSCRHQHPSTASLKTKLIVNLNRQEWWFSNDKLYENVFRSCLYNACRFTDDKTSLPEADAVFVTVCRLNIKTPPVRYSSKQIWIAFALESPVHYSGFHRSPAWKNVFNWTMGYRPDSDIFAPYSRLVVRSVPSAKNYTNIALRKTKAVAWFVSNCGTQGKRELYVKELQKYIDVDIYGACSDKKCPRNKESDCLRLLNTTYYFYLSFENSLCQDYVTEKFFKLFNNVDVIPVVRGGANYRRYFPPGTYINTADYPGAKHLAAHLKTIIQNLQTYTLLLQTKDKFTTTVNGQIRHGCDLCKHLHTKGSESKVYADFMDWTQNNKCHSPSDLSQH